MDEINNRPKVGIAIYILNKQNELLLMLRKGRSHSGTWAPPGGHLELGEEFLDCVKRETAEEVGLRVKEGELWAVNNNIFTPESHYVNLDYLVRSYTEEAKNLEPEKCEKIQWFPLGNLPTPLMYSVQNFFKNNPKCLCKSGKSYKDCHGK